MARDSLSAMSDSGLRDWILNFVSVLEAAPLGPSEFGLSAELAAAVISASGVYVAAYAKANEEATRGPLSIREKDEARDSLLKVAREAVAVIQANPDTTNNQRQALRVKIRDTTRSVVPPPSVAPTLLVTGVLGNVISVRIKDSTDLNRRAKPEGVNSTTLFYAVGEAPPAEPEGWTFSGTTSKTSTQVQLPPGTAGGTSVWLIAFYANTKTQSGPPSVPVQTWTQVTASNPAQPDGGTTLGADEQSPRLAA